MFFIPQIMKQNYKHYTQEDHLVWKLLFKRQQQNLLEKASEVYNNCLHTLSPCLNAESIPNFDEINRFFKKHTNWQIQVVPGLIPVDEFFDLLAAKKFCSSTWLRTKEQIDYLEEPDMFHDIFGHIPLLINPTFSKFAQEFGKLGQQFKDDKEILVKLQRIYWFTIEFGLIRENGELKVYGGGIASSYGETNHIFVSNLQHLAYDIYEVMNCEFHTDSIQDKYFVIKSFEDLINSIRELTIKLKQTA